MAVPCWQNADMGKQLLIINEQQMSVLFTNQTMKNQCCLVRVYVFAFVPLIFINH